MREVNAGTIMIIQLMFEKKLINDETYKNICKKYHIGE